MRWEQRQRLLNEILAQRDRLELERKDYDGITVDSEVIDRKIQIERALATNAVALSLQMFPAHCKECCPGSMFSNLDIDGISAQIKERLQIK
jgi:hypothetical protein